MLITATSAAPEASFWLPGLIIILGLLGVIIPVIPGLIVALVGVLIWALDLGSSTGWIIFGVCVALYAAGLTLQFLIPGKKMKAAGIATSTLFLGLALGIVGFFVVPIIGGPLGFVLGIYLYSQGTGAALPRPFLHILYGIVSIITLPAAYGYFNTLEDEKVKALAMAAACFFLWGIILRAGYVAQFAPPG